MRGIIAILYGTGYLLVVASVSALEPVTTRGIKRMKEAAGSLFSWHRDYEQERTAELDRDAMSETDYAEASGRIRSDAIEPVRARAKAMDVPFEHELEIGGARSEKIASAVRRVGRAIIPTAIIALLGGLHSKVASIWSLYV